MVLMLSMSLNMHATNYEINDNIFDENTYFSGLDNSNKKLELKAKKCLRMARAAYNRYDYKKCLSFIKEYEQLIKDLYQGEDLNLEDKLTIAFYKAYSSKFLKKYESALESFREAIELLESANFAEKECLWSAYYQRASCNWGLGKISRCKKEIEELVAMDIGLTSIDVKEGLYMVIRQPNLLPTSYPITKDPLMLDKTLAKQIAKNVLDLHQTKALIPKTCACSNKNLRGHYSRYCISLSNCVAFAASLIPNSSTQSKVLLALIEFEISALDCCETCLKKDPGPENLNFILENLFNVNMKDEESEEFNIPNIESEEFYNYNNTISS